MERLTSRTNQFLIDQARTCAVASAKILPTLVCDVDVSLVKARPAIAKLHVRDAWRQMHFPNINIVGLPKAGTSHLYLLLSGHNELRHSIVGKNGVFIISTKS